MKQPTEAITLDRILCDLPRRRGSRDVALFVSVTFLFATLSGCGTSRPQVPPPPTAEGVPSAVATRVVLMAVTVRADSPAREVYGEDFLSAFSKQSGIPRDELREVTLGKLNPAAVPALVLLSPLVLAGAAIIALFFVLTSPVWLPVELVSHAKTGHGTKSSPRVVLCPGRTTAQVLADAQKAALALGFGYLKRENEELLFSRTREGGEEAQLTVSAWETSSESFELVSP
jgi:hypothetical protein